jgi:hypothetical protein
VERCREGGGLELGVFHARTLLPVDCGSLVYKSYSRGTTRTLYGSYKDIEDKLEMGTGTWMDKFRAEIQSRPRRESI